MKHAAIGVRMHSGWGALVVISRDGSVIELIDRRRIVTTDPDIPGANQPYHFARKLECRAAANYLASCADVSRCLALAAVREIAQALHDRDFRLVGSGVLLASGRMLPTLSVILASHALIHTAEGEFFRRTYADACERLGIRVTGFREREIDQRAKAVFGRATARSDLGKSLGPPWTKDQKTAALAASMVLFGSTETPYPSVPRANPRANASRSA
ncbi:MAG: hypothetical protein NVS4B3_07560 [Gemmatimonadaceae bacterium]